jgi:hypothetical protein
MRDERYVFIGSEPMSIGKGTLIKNDELTLTLLDGSVDSVLLGIGISKMIFVVGSVEPGDSSYVGIRYQRKESQSRRVSSQLGTIKRSSRISCHPT